MGGRQHDDALALNLVFISHTARAPLPSLPAPSRFFRLSFRCRSHPGAPACCKACRSPPHEHFGCFGVIQFRLSALACCPIWSVPACRHSIHNGLLHRSGGGGADAVADMAADEPIAALIASEPCSPTELAQPDKTRQRQDGAFIHFVSSPFHLTYQCLRL